MGSPNTIHSTIDDLRASPKVRREAGRSRRETVPLEAHAEVRADAAGRDPLSILAQQDATRLAEVVPIRYWRMSRTPFTCSGSITVNMAWPHYAEHGVAPLR